MYRVMVFNATFNNISVILWRLVLLVEETGVPGKTFWSVESHWQTLSHNVVSSPWVGFELTTLVVASLIAQVIAYLTTIRSRLWCPPNYNIGSKHQQLILIMYVQVMVGYWKQNVFQRILFFPEILLRKLNTINVCLFAL